VIRQDSQSWQQFVDHALPLMDHLLVVTASRLDLTKPEGRTLATEQLLPIIAELEDRKEEELYLKKLAGLLGVRERTLEGMAARLHSTRREKPYRVELKTSVRVNIGNPAEEQCLSLLLQYSELRDKAEKLLPEHFELTENREIFIAWRDVSNPEELLDVIDVDLQQHLKSLFRKVSPPADERKRERALDDCVHRLEEQRLRDLKVQEEYLLSDAESEGRNEDIDVLQQRGVEINLKLKETFENAMQITSPYKEDQ
jgi:DNA primase